VIQLDHQKRKNIVWEYIHNHDGSGFNEICDQLDKDPKTRMSRNTVAGIISELKNEDFVANKAKSKQKFAFTTKVIAVQKEKKHLNKFDRTLAQYEKKLKKLQKLFAEQELYLADKLTLLRRFAHAFWFLDFQLYTIDEVSTEKEREIRIHRLNNLRKRFFDLAWNDSEDKQVYGLLLHDLQEISEGYEADYDAEFDDSEYEGKMNKTDY